MTGSLHAELSLTLDRADAWLDEQVKRLAEHDLLPVSRSPDAVEFQSSYGRFRLQAHGTDLQVRVESADAGGLEVLQETVSFYLLAHDGTLADRMVWRGYDPQESLPANFREMEVIDRRLVSPWMIRLTLKGRDIDHFAERGLHVRLMVPPAGIGRPPVWPKRSRSGAVVLPEGPDALTVRVYTIRAISLALGEIDVDVVRHAGGAVADWAEVAAPGDRVGVMGPGGGSYPKDGWLLIGGDETALPAISRILEKRPKDARGHAVIGLRNAEARIDPVAPDGFTVQWVVGGDGALVEAMRSVALPADAGVWFAGEAETARQVRAHFREDLGLPAACVASAGYWRRDGSA
ncbi:siderophore-interacting protein [Thalassobaculum sp. OXR-137]|uniref:siderophore-interacting protein n=1 Tax=Thalassobaculum sp. OXR-137 TaxID=3100173 RepID=UPI002AC918D7|nr:siderophore-interacting protein [Thalassobaculum sp. OXR-137]WPZ33746.1 siderophore-interacting protein [Thalassobaculum sp. OXR-137]